jgi:hypothetical protein
LYSINGRSDPFGVPTFVRLVLPFECRYPGGSGARGVVCAAPRTPVPPRNSLAKPCSIPIRSSGVAECGEPSEFGIRIDFGGLDIGRVAHNELNS